MKGYTSTVNMTPAELKAWVKNPRNLLASIETGHESLRRLAIGDHAHDRAFARKVDNFNTRHGLSTNLFDKEIGRSGWSKRAIALRNWGHDPSKQDSPLYKADRRWLAEHDGALERRRGRVKNPVVITEIEAPEDNIELVEDFAPFMETSLEGAGIDIYRTMPGKYAIGCVEEDVTYGDSRTIVPIGDVFFTIGILKNYTDYPVSAREQAESVADMFVEDVSTNVPNFRDHEPCLCQLSPALASGIQSKYPIVGRTPNPPLSQWILPVAQLLLSASGFAVSSIEILELFGKHQDQKSK